MGTAAAAGEVPGATKFSKQKEDYKELQLILVYYLNYFDYIINCINIIKRFKNVSSLLYFPFSQGPSSLRTPFAALCLGAA